MIIGSNLVYRNPITGEMHPALELPNGNYHQLQTDCVYILGDHVYPYFGLMDSTYEFRTMKRGGIAYIDRQFFFQPHPDDQEELYRTSHIITKEDADRLSMLIEEDIGAVMDRYIAVYRSGNNLLANAKDRGLRSDEYYTPEITSKDDPFERLMKIMIHSMKIVSSEYRKRERNSSAYSFDNLCSALDGATEHLSILKLLQWCHLLELDYQFSIFDICENDYPLSRIIDVSNHDDHWVEIPPSTDKEYFRVPLTTKDDPFKRLIKLALYYKGIPTREYRHKGSTPHQINNMKSALKGVQKTTSDYFLTWCDLLNLGYSFQLTNPATGITYQTIGYDITTNDPEPPASYQELSMAQIL